MASVFSVPSLSGHFMEVKNNLFFSARRRQRTNRAPPLVLRLSWAKSLMTVGLNCCFYKFVYPAKSFSGLGSVPKGLFMKGPTVFNCSARIKFRNNLKHKMCFPNFYKEGHNHVVYINMIDIDNNHFEEELCHFLCVVKMCRNDGKWST